MFKKSEDLKVSAHVHNNQAVTDEIFQDIFPKRVCLFLRNSRLAGRHYVFITQMLVRGAIG